MKLLSDYYHDRLAEKDREIEKLKSSIQQRNLIDAVVGDRQ